MSQLVSIFVTMKQSILKPSHKEIIKYVDRDTGEILDQEVKQHTYLASTKEQFFLGYVSMLAVFNDLTGNAIKTYAYLLERYNAGALIAINSGIKEDIKQFIKSKAQSNKGIDGALAELVKVKFLIRKSHGTYLINPRYAFKGSTKDRDASLKAILTLECPEC